MNIKKNIAAAASRDILELFKNFLYLGILRGSDIIIPLLLLPYIVRTVGLENFGTLAFSLSIASLFGSLIQYGFSITAVREISLARNSKENLSKLYSTYLTSSLIIAAGVLLVYAFVLTAMKNNINSEIYYYSIAFVSIQSSIPIWFFQGIEKMKYSALITSLAKISYMVMILSLVKTEDDYVKVHLLNAIAAIIGLLTSFYIINFKMKVRYSFPTMKMLKWAYKSSAYACVNQITPNLYNNAAVFLLGLSASKTTVGAYGAAVTIIEATVSVGRIMAGVFLPYLARKPLNFRYFKWIMITAALAVTTILMLFSTLIANLITTENQSLISHLIFLMALSVVPAYAYLTFNSCYLMLRKKEKEATRITFLTSMIFFVLALLIIPVWQIYAAVFVLVSARATMAIFSHRAYKIQEQLK